MAEAVSRGSLAEGHMMGRRQLIKALGKHIAWKTHYPALPLVGLDSNVSSYPRAMVWRGSINQIWLKSYFL